MRAERWLFVDSIPVFGGHEVMLLRWMEELAARGRVEPHLLARRDCRLHERGRAWAVAEGFAPAEPPPARKTPWARLAQPVRDTAVFIRTARRLRPSLCVVAEGCLLSQALFVALGRVLGLKVVVYVPLVDRFAAMGLGRARLKDWLMKRVYGNLPHGWITITAGQAEGFARWAGIRRPVFALPNTVAPAVEALAGNRFVGIQEQREESHLNSIGLPPLPPGEGGGEGERQGKEILRILILGRLDAHHKGLDLLLDCLEAAPWPDPFFRIDLVGDGPYASEIERRREASPALAERLSVRPWSDPVQAMAEHDVLLLPSRFEGVPLVMLEAMALGLPVVASDLPGTRAHLPEDCLFPVGDLARAFDILRRLKDPAERLALAERNRRAFAEKASGAAFAEAVAGLTEKLSREVARP